MAKVNLDALIQREDFEIREDQIYSLSGKDTLSYLDLKQGEFFFSSLRKPDFQRETSEWDSQKICDFIKSFLDEDLIPALILWRGTGTNYFVIDGAHRISALAAWINNDYGDGEISKRFYDGVIPEEQIDVAEKTRTLIRKKIGPFQDYKLAIEHPDKVTSTIADGAKRLGAIAIQLQWVHGDAAKAEASFFKINQQASAINPTELLILNSRKKPNAIAARAIVRSGRGHKYWSSFPSENQAKIEELASDIHTILFNPKYDNPIKTLDLPIGGKAYSGQSLPLILDFINIVNKERTRTDNKGKEIINDDLDGLETIEYLSRCRKVVQRMNSSHPGSLGLHPIVYFYSQIGRYKVGSFLGITALLLEFEKRNLYKKFTLVRENFENLLIKYDYLTQQIIRKRRSVSASYNEVSAFYLNCIEKLSTQHNIDTVIGEIVKDKQFDYLLPALEETSPEFGQDFSQETKSEAFIREARARALRCQICNGLMHRNSISIDHKIRKQDGGWGDSDNAQLTHPFCNSTIKN